MTRLEQLLKQKAEQQDKLKQAKLKAAQVDAELRSEAAKARNKLRYRWGKILDHLGLLDEEDATLKEVLAVAYRLVQKKGIIWQDAPTASPTEAEVQEAIARLMTEQQTLVLKLEKNGSEM